MKKIFQHNSKTLKYLHSLPSMYLVVCWYNYGLMRFPFSGKYVKRDVYKRGEFIDVPLVWNYNDHNGTEDRFELVPLDTVTTGRILMWTQNEDIAKEVALLFRKKIDPNS